MGTSAKFDEKKREEAAVVAEGEDDSLLLLLLLGFPVRTRLSDSNARPPTCVRVEHKSSVWIAARISISVTSYTYIGRQSAREREALV